MTGTIFRSDALHLRLWLTALGINSGLLAWDCYLDDWLAERLRGDRSSALA